MSNVNIFGQTGTQGTPGTQGFSLIGALAGLIVGAIGLYVIASTIQLSSKSRKTDSQHGAFLALVSSINTIIENPEACRINWEGMTFDMNQPLNFPKISLFLPNKDQNEGRLIAELGRVVEGMRIQKFDMVFESVLSEREFLVKIILETIRLERNGSRSALGVPIKSREFLVKLFADSLGDSKYRVFSCISHNSTGIVHLEPEGDSGRDGALRNARDSHIDFMAGIRKERMNTIQRAYKEVEEIKEEQEEAIESRDKERENFSEWYLQESEGLIDQLTNQKAKRDKYEKELRAAEMILAAAPLGDEELQKKLQRNVLLAMEKFNKAKRDVEETIGEQAHLDIKYRQDLADIRMRGSSEAFSFAERINEQFKYMNQAEYQALKNMDIQRQRMSAKIDYKDKDERNDRRTAGSD